MTKEDQVRWQRIEKLQAQQGWNDSSLLSMMKSFIQDSGNTRAFLRICEDQAADEEAEAKDEDEGEESEEEGEEGEEDL